MSDKHQSGPEPGVSRRQLMKRGGALAGGALIAGGVAGAPAAPTAEAQAAELLSNALRALSPSQALTLEAVLERLPTRLGQALRRRTSCATSTGRSRGICRCS